MGPFELASRWRALRLHFGRWEYDYFKFNGKVKGLEPEKFNRSKERWAFERLMKRHDPIEYMVTCILEKREEHITEAVRDSDIEQLHLQRRGRVESLSRHVENELKYLDVSNLENNFLGNPPLLLYHFWGKRISREVASCLLVMHSYSPDIWKGVNDWMVNNSVLQLFKYFPWTYCDKEKIAGIIVRRCLQDPK